MTGSTVSEPADTDMQPSERDKQAAGEGTEAAPDSHGRIGYPLLPSGAWRDETLRKADELHAVAFWMVARQPASAAVQKHLHEIERHLRRAREVAGARDRRHWWRKLGSPTDSSTVDAALGSLDAAEAGLLRVTPTTELSGQMPSVEAQVYRYLPK